MGDVIAGIVVARLPRAGVDRLTFVPADGDRARRRGHSPPRELAHRLGTTWQIPVEPLLRRSRPVARQTGLQRGERQSNMRGAFLASRECSGSIGVVDDVYTTGATVAAAASALRAAGAARVEVITFARAVR